VRLMRHIYGRILVVRTWARVHDRESPLFASDHVLGDTRPGSKFDV
jgi:hypothetical protein